MKNILILSFFTFFILSCKSDQKSGSDATAEKQEVVNQKFGDVPPFPQELMAKLFNDTFAIIPPTDPTKFKIEQTGIAWESDVKYKFKNSDNLEKQW